MRLLLAAALLAAPAGAQDAAALARLDAHIQAQLPHLRSLLIARHDRLVFERYYGGAGPETLQNLQSMTKSVTSALVGISLRKGLLASLDAKVLEFFPEHSGAVADPRMKGITLRHLLTMSSGIDELGLSFDKTMPHPIREILARRLLYAPGGGFKYSSAAAHLLGGVLAKATGGAVEAFARRELFEPLGVSRFVWYSDSDGIHSGGLSGLWRARDFLKLGQLYLDQGKWHGAELIPAAYVADSIALHSQGDFYGEAARYGYMWWLSSPAGQDAFYARGYGGQYLMVIPRLELVVLCTSDWQRPEYPEHFALVEKFIIPAALAK